MNNTNNFKIELKQPLIYEKNLLVLSLELLAYLIYNNVPYFLLNNTLTITPPEAKLHLNRMNPFTALYS